MVVSASVSSAMMQSKRLVGPNPVAEEVGLGGLDGVGFALVGGEVSDELQDLRDVGGGWRGGD